MICPGTPCAWNKESEESTGYGQSKDVHIYYLALKNTLDEQLLSLLYEKLDLFERVIGELDDILERLNIQNLDEEIKEIFARSKSAGEARIKIDNLTAAFHDVTEYPARGGRI